MEGVPHPTFDLTPAAARTVVISTRAVAQMPEMVEVWPVFQVMG